MLRTDTKLGSTLLLTGTSIGAAMLTLPVVTSPSGLLGALLILGFAWLFMCYTGLLTLEANLPLPPGSNYRTMTQLILGASWSGWTLLTTVIYMGLFYALIAAYFTAIVDFIHAVWGLQWHGSGAHITLASVVTVAVMLLVCFGVRLVDHCNRFLLLLLILAFAGMFVTLLPFAHTKPVFLTSHWSSVWTAIPVVMTAFGFHVLIPSIRVYMASQKKALCRVIVWGCTIPLLIYLMWLLVLFFTLPTNGSMSLPGLLKSSMPEVDVLKVLSNLTHARLVVWFAHAFILSAILTSLLGIAMAMLGFFRSELAVDMSKRALTHHPLVPVVLTFLPPWFFTCFYPHGFLLALEFSGLFVLYLHGILPLMMVWVLQGRTDITRLPDWSMNRRLPLVFGFLVCTVLIVGQIWTMLH